MTGILAKSSNVGTIMLARKVGDEKLEHYMRAFGIGSTTGVELPGESRGILQDSADWTAGRAANVPIGQGVSVTTLQMASIYQTIANGGVRIAPRIVGSVTDPDGRRTRRPRPTRPASSAQATPPTRWPTCSRPSSVRAGPRRWAQIEGFRVAARPARRSGPTPSAAATSGGGYVTTFVGFAPADAPAVRRRRRPRAARRASAEGGQVAAPVFADVMRYALTADGVVPSGHAPAGVRARRRRPLRPRRAARPRSAAPGRGRGARPPEPPPVDWSPVTPTDAGSAPRPAGNRPLPAAAALADLVGATVGPAQPARDPQVRGVTLASAEVRPGDLYAALPGCPHARRPVRRRRRRARAPSPS